MASVPLQKYVQLVGFSQEQYLRELASAMEGQLGLYRCVPACLIDFGEPGSIE